ncbi:hypothetical protein NL676_034079 [Syzygium grande]|nr:hypothetical protein NL676_034079 [Syzygium grande]
MKKNLLLPLPPLLPAVYSVQHTNIDILTPERSGDTLAARPRPGSQITVRFKRAAPPNPTAGSRRVAHQASLSPRTARPASCSGRRGKRESHLPSQISRQINAGPPPPSAAAAAAAAGGTTAISGLFSLSLPLAPPLSASRRRREAGAGGFATAGPTPFRPRAPAHLLRSRRASASEVPPSPARSTVSPELRLRRSSLSPDLTRLLQSPPCFLSPPVQARRSSSSSDLIRFLQR